MTGETVIVGAGGMAREAVAWWNDAASATQTGRLRGILDDDPAKAGESIDGHPVLGTLDWLADNADVEAVVAIGDPAVRRRVSERLVESGATFSSIVHPTAVVGPGVDLGPGCIIGPRVVLTRDIRVGRGAIVNYGAALGHDSAIGDFAFVGPGVHTGGNVRIGAEAWIGIGACVIQGIAIGSQARVGAGAAVVADVASGVTALGVPARERRAARS